MVHDGHMTSGYQLTAEDRTAFQLLADASRLYDEYLVVAEVGRIQVDVLEDQWAPSAPVQTPLTFAFRSFG